MYYCLICYPRIDTTNVEIFRKKYDTAYDHIKAHMTFVFPINTNNIDRSILVDHINKITKSFSVFEISLEGFEKSWDHYLFLNITKGKENFIGLHDELYTDVLEPFLRKDLPFSPHLTLGHFIGKNNEYKISDPKQVVFDESTYNKALIEAGQSNMKYATKIDSLTLITLNDDFSRILESEEFRLKK